MKKGFHRIVVAVLAVALTMTMFSLPAFAAAQDPQQPVQGDQSVQAKGAPPSRNAGSQAKRTIMLYDCGSNLETDAGLATYNLMQILASRFSSDDDIRFLVMTGGSHKWQIDADKLVFPDEVSLPDDAVVAYDTAKREYAARPSDPKSQVSNVYNQVWEARGIDATIEGGNQDPNAGKMVLLDGDGITGTENEPVKSEEELMSDPKTLQAFINYGVARYPAEKYDLILWDHGGGPKGGFGVDEHHDDGNAWLQPDIMSFDGIVEALSDNAVTNNDADRDGNKDKFDFVDFDACLMNSVELALAMADCTDYYIASAETEPGYGQYYGPCADADGKQYKGWLDELGNSANDARYNTPNEAGKFEGTYELGKVIVDDFYNFYEKDTGDGHSQEGTLAVIDTEKMMDSQFVETLTEMIRILTNEAGHVEETGLYFYDELKSFYNSIEYGGSELFDLGNLAALLSVVKSEVSEDHMDEEDNYYININDYHDIPRTLNQLLADEVFMYAKGTSGIKTEEQYYRTLEDELGFGALGSSGMSIFFPGVEMTMSATEYFDEIDPVIDRLQDNDKRKQFLKDYEKAVAYYSLILYSGKVIDMQINDEDNALETSMKSDVDYDQVMKQMKDPIVGNWGTLVTRCMEKIGIDEEGIEDWFRALISQQAGDAVDGKEVKLERLDQEDTGACKVTVNGAKKRIINSVERSVYVELPALEEYVGKLPAEKQRIMNGTEQFSVGSIEGTVEQPAGDSIREKIRWYNQSGGVWNIDAFEEKWYAVRDAAGAEHVASIYLSDEDGFYVPAFIETSTKAMNETPQLMLEFAPEGDHKLKSIYYMNTETGPVQVEPKSLTGTITVMPALVVRQMFDPDIYVPISHSSFPLSAANADSIRLDFMDIADIADIGDTDGDGRVFDTAITITDMYGYRIVVSDRVHIKWARIRPAVSTGKELEPELVYGGQTLRPGVDYVLEKERKWNPETKKLEAPAFVEPGDYMVSVYGKGPFTGRKYEAVFSIVGSGEAAQALIDQAQEELSAAQSSMKAAIESGSPQKLERAYTRLVNAQNALADAQAILEKEKQAALEEKNAALEEKQGDLEKKQAELEAKQAELDKKNAKLEEQIAKLEQQIRDLNDQLAQISVIDISNYAVTMKTSFTYTGKAIKPKVKVSGLNSSAYRVTYSKNKKVGTASVVITAKAPGYKGKITKSFKIKPRKAGVPKVKTGKKKMTVTAKTKVSRTGGKIYQIRYRVKGTSKWKTIKTKKKKVTIRKLKKGKRYQVKMRACSKINGKLYYGAWSKIKTTKKIK